MEYIGIPQLSSTNPCISEKSSANIQQAATYRDKFPQKKTYRDKIPTGSVH
jgi:hypothetical protein